jgi:hypothetical protein
MLATVPFRISHVPDWYVQIKIWTSSLPNSPYRALEGSATLVWIRPSGSHFFVFRNNHFLKSKVFSLASNRQAGGPRLRIYQIKIYIPVIFGLYLFMWKKLGFSEPLPVSLSNHQYNPFIKLIEAFRQKFITLVYIRYFRWVGTSVPYHFVSYRCDINPILHDIRKCTVGFCLSPM